MSTILFFVNVLENDSLRQDAIDYKLNASLVALKMVFCDVITGLVGWALITRLGY